MAIQERRLNKRFVGFLTIGIMVILTIGIALMVTLTARKDPKIYADRGDRFMKAGNYVEAAKNYGSAFRYSKKDPKWLVKIAEAQYMGGDERKAIGSLKNAVVADSTLVPAQKRLMEIYFALIGRTASPAAMKSMEEDADRLIKMIPDKSAEKDPELRKALALGYHCRGVARYGRRTENADLVKSAMDDINKALALDARPEYVVSKAGIILGDAQEMLRAARVDDITPETYIEIVGRMRHQIEKAEAVYLSLAKGTKPTSETLVTLGDFYYGICGGTEKALGRYCQSLTGKLSENIAQANRQLAGLTQEKNISAEEKRRARQRASSQISQWNREIPEWTSLAGKHEALAKKYNDKALDLYKNAVAAATTKEQKIASQISLANYYLANDGLEDAERLVREAIKADPAGLPAYRMLSEILKRSGDLAVGKRQEEKRAEAITILAERIYKIPTKTEGAKGRQNRILRLELMARLVDLYLDRNKGDDLKNADGALKELGTSELAEVPAVYLLKARRAIVGNDMIAAIKMLEKADTMSNEQNPQVKLALAELYYRRGELGAAKKAVMAGLALDPNSVNGWRLASSVLLQLGDAEGALGYANRILANRKKDKEALALKLDCLAKLGRLNEADNIVGEMNSQGTKFDWNLQKARLLIGQGKSKEAETLLAQVLSAKPGDKVASAYLVEVYLGSNKKAKIPGVLKTALEKNPGDKELTRLQELMAITDPVKQLERMKEVSREVREENMRVALTQAQEEKDPYTRAVRLADQYLQRNETDQAKKHLDEAVKLNPKRANSLNFRFSLIVKDWERARKCADFGKAENLDGMKGLTYESELANAQGWDLVVKAQNAEAAKKTDEAKKYFEQGKAHFEQSARAAEQIIAELPSDSEAHALLGEAYFWLNRQNEAAIQINQGLELNPGNSYALRAASAREWGEIVANGNQVSPEVVQAFAGHVRKAYQQMPWDEWLKGRATWLNQQVEKRQEYQDETTGDARKAVANREQRRKTDPNDTENLIRLAGLYENREAVRDLAKAEECYRQALERSPSQEAVRSYLEFARRNKRVEEMEKFLNDLAVRQAGRGQAGGYSMLGYYYLTVGEAGKSEKAFLDAVKTNEGAEKRLEMALFYAQISDWDKAAEWSRKTLEAKTNAAQEKSARYLLINALFSLKQWDQAKAQIEAFKKEITGNEGQLLEVQLAVKQGRMSDAERLLTGMVEKSPENVEILNQRAMVYLYTWQLEKARADLEKISAVNSGRTDLNTRIRLVRLACEMGRVADADRAARELITQVANQSPNSLENLRTDMLSSLSLALPEKTYEDILTWASNLTPAYWGWWYSRGQFLQLRRKDNQAEQAFRQAWDLIEKNGKVPGDLKFLIMDSYLTSMFRQAEYQKVVQAVDRALGRLPKNASRILCWQAAAYYAGGQKKKGVELFLKALDTAGKNPIFIWQVTRDTMLKAAKGSDLAGMLETAMSTDPKNPMAVEIALACCYFNADQVEKGASLYRKWAAKAENPNIKAITLFALAQDYSDKRMYTEGVKALAEAQQYVPGNPAVLNNQAYILAANLDQPREALKLIDVAFPKDPNNPDLLDTYGLVLSQVDRTEEGMYQLARSVWARASAANRYHLGKILLKQNRRKDAESQMRQALLSVGDDKDLEKQIRETLKKI